MSTKRAFLKGLVVVSVAAMLCGYVLAAEQSTQRDQDKNKQQGQQTQQGQQSTQQTQQQKQQGMQSMGGITGMQTSGTLHRTSKIIGKDVKGAQNENLGSVYDLVLTSDDQEVSYAALSSGGTWGMGAKYYAIPWSALQVNSQGDITTSLTKSQLDQASFDKNNWPAQASPQLMSSTSSGAMSGQSSQMGTQRQSTDQTRDRDATDAGRTRSGQTSDRSNDQPGAIGSQTDTGSQTGSATGRQGTMDTARDRQTMGQTGAAMGSDMTASNKDVQYRRVSNLTGTAVRNAQGEDIGNIEDFVVDTTGGQVAYTVVSFGGFWGIGEKLAAVPATAVEIEARRHVARLDADRATLEKVAFKADEFPDLSNKEYAQRLHETFNAEPYSPVLGYVGSKDQATSQKAWGNESQFAKQFNAKNVTTIQGTVQSVGNFQPEGGTSGTSGGLRIRITTDDGKLVTVYGGPQSYAQQHDFYLKPGDKISVTGSETKIGWRQVLVASQIKSGDKTLMLRNESGQPLWQSQQGQQPGQSTTTGQPRSGQSGQPGSTSGTSGTGGTSGTQYPQGQGQPKP
jgi:sporulation protein YlmC with PRC-barrel domain